MRKRRFLPAERAIHENVFWRGGKPFFATDHMRDFHVMIVDDVGEVVCGKTVGFQKRLIIQFVVFDGNLSSNFIKKRCFSFRNEQADHVRQMFGDPAIDFLIG